MRRALRGLRLALLVWALVGSLLALGGSPGAAGAHVPEVDFGETDAGVSVGATAGAPRAGAAVRVREGGVDDAGGRLLAGVDRYATAVALAERAVDARGGAGADGEAYGGVVVVSGESLVDALSAVPLAAASGGVVVLTRRDSLPDVVAGFVRRYGAGGVSIVGGTDAVSNDVARHLSELAGRDAAGDDLAGVAAVEQFAGADRYETAVLVARAAGTPGGWCGEASPAVLLVNGDSLIDGVLAAPVAYAMGLPVLFTRADALPDAVRAYLTDTGVARAVLIGSTAEVSLAVPKELAGLNVAVTRIDGATPAARSVALADAVSACGAASDEFALLDADQPVDGVAAAALLANGISPAHGVEQVATRQSLGLVPVLAVDQELPTAVAQHLTEHAATNPDVTLYALGGTSRITPQVMRDALNAATGNSNTKAGDDTAGERASTSDRDEARTQRVSVGRGGDKRSDGGNAPRSGSTNEARATTSTTAAPTSTTTSAASDGDDFSAPSAGESDSSEVSPTLRAQAEGPDGIEVAPPADELPPFVVIEASVGATSVRLLTLEENPSVRLTEIAPDEEDITLVLSGTDISVRPDGSNPHGVHVFAAGRASDVDSGHYLVHLPNGDTETVPVAWGRLWDVGWGCDRKARSASDCAGRPALAHGDQVSVAPGALIDAFGNRSAANEFVLVDPNVPAPTTTIVASTTTSTTTTVASTTTSTTTTAPPATTSTTTTAPPTSTSTTTTALPTATSTTTSTEPVATEEPGPDVGVDVPDSGPPPGTTTTSSTTSTTVPPPSAPSSTTAAPVTTTSVTATQPSTTTTTEPMPPATTTTEAPAQPSTTTATSEAPPTTSTTVAPTTSTTVPPPQSTTTTELAQDPEPSGCELPPNVRNLRDETASHQASVDSTGSDTSLIRTYRWDTPRHWGGSGCVGKRGYDVSVTEYYSVGLAEALAERHTSWVGDRVGSVEGTGSLGKRFTHPVTSRIGSTRTITNAINQHDTEISWHIVNVRSYNRDKKRGPNTLLASKVACPRGSPAQLTDIDPPSFKINYVAWLDSVRAACGM